MIVCAPIEMNLVVVIVVVAVVVIVVVVVDMVVVTYCSDPIIFICGPED